MVAESSEETINEVIRAALIWKREQGSNPVFDRTEWKLYEAVENLQTLSNERKGNV